MTVTPHDPARRPIVVEETSTGRPVLFAVLLALAVLGTLALLVTGPMLALGHAIVAAVAIMSVMTLAWAVAGPRW
ncbi:MULTISPECIES: hypothetical protein [unclassified Brachybacterium]|uniref:hypothetical protein n=1 Tax=unclassified Brachybacterium TaxID=2623841 RepID=UPI000C7FDD60|nr:MULTISPECIES: hypothetical protein [unclassified Brachybacterium]PMC75133.1 hypothetical protein CJ197_10285 [Brachybacterium sp. UMB0905]